MKIQLSPVLLTFALFSSTVAVDARRLDAVANAPAEVTVELHKGGDKVDFKVLSKQPLKKLTMRWMQNPRRLRLTIPEAHLASPAGRVAIDKGVLRWAEAQSSGDSVTVDLATISNPKSKFSVGSDQHSLTWVASTTDIAAGDQVPSLPSSLAAESSGGESAVAPPKKPKPEKPAPKVASAEHKPVAAQAKPEKSETHTIAAVPKETVAPKEKPEVSAVKPGDRLVSLAANGELRGALTALAKAAGLKAEIDPGVQGAVTVSFMQVPLNKAVSSILGQQSDLYTYTISDTTLKVTAPAGSGGHTVTPTNSNPVAVGGKTMSEYFPIRDKRAGDILAEVRKQIPSLSYTVDDRLNQILAEGDPSDLERLRKLLQRVSNK